LEAAIDFGGPQTNNHTKTGGAMAVTTTPPGEDSKTGRDRELPGIGATEDQVNMRNTIPQRIDRFGTKIEDLAGTGEHDSGGG
jgi:hypothetical protein